jgi:hypothetical protein
MDVVDTYLREHFAEDTDAAVIRNIMMLSRSPTMFGAILLGLD